VLLLPLLLLCCWVEHDRSCGLPDTSSAAAVLLLPIGRHRRWLHLQPRNEARRAAVPLQASSCQLGWQPLPSLLLLMLLPPAGAGGARYRQAAAVLLG
jgi:hypothetical protein